MAYSFTIFGITFYSYSLFVFFGVVAFLVYSYVILKKVEKENDTTIYKTVLIAAPSLAILAASAFILNSLFHSIEKGKIVIGGITWAGGIFGAFIAFPLLTRFFIKEKRGQELEYFSRLVPGIALGHAFGRVGCFLAGCCYGSITSCPLGVIYPAGSAPALEYTDFLNGGQSFPLMPVQLFEVAFELILFIIMIATYKKSSNHNISIYLIAYGIFRFLLEFLRGDDRGATGIVISPSQMMSILFIVSGIVLILYQKRIFKTNKINEKT